MESWRSLVDGVLRGERPSIESFIRRSVPVVAAITRSLLQRSVPATHLPQALEEEPNLRSWFLERVLFEERHALLRGWDEQHRGFSRHLAEAVASNLRDHLRTLPYPWAAHAVQSEVLTGIVTPAQAETTEITREQIATLLDQSDTDSDERALLWAYYGEELTYKQLAERFHTTEEAVAKRMRRLLARIRRSS